MALCILYIIHITFGYFYIFLSLVIFFASLQDQHLLICLIVGIVLRMPSSAVNELLQKAKYRKERDVFKCLQKNTCSKQFLFCSNIPN